MFLKSTLNLFARSSTLSLPARFSTGLTGRQQQQPSVDTKVGPAVNAGPAKADGATHRPSAMDRKYLVWSGKYKSESDIPEYVR